MGNIIAYEVIYKEKGRIIGNSEINVNSLIRVENGWMQGDKFLPEWKILLTIDKSDYV